MGVPVARRNLLAEKGRFAISVAGVGVAVLLILTVLSLYRGWSRTGETFEDLPGQLWITQRGTSDPFHSVSLVELTDLQRVQSLPGVVATVPVLQRQMEFEAGGSTSRARLMALAIPEDYPTSEDLRTRFLPEKGQLIIDETVSRKSGLDEGDTATFGPVTVTVARVAPRSPEVLTPFAFVNFEDAQEIFGVHDIVTYGMVVLDDGASVEQVQREIASQGTGFRVYTATEFAESIRAEIDDTFIPVIIILVAIGFVVGAAVVGLTIYTATIERSREFGVMKAVGGSPGFLYRIVLTQSVLLATSGFTAGLLGAMVVTNLAARAVPEFATQFLGRDIGVVFVFALAMAALASLVPVRRINRIDPAIVFKA
jgi:putative ABC transport system permease protein